MIDELTKKRWYLHFRQTKVISVAGYPEFMNDIFISFSPDSLVKPRLMNLSGMLVHIDSKFRDDLEYKLGEYLVNLHNSNLDKSKVKADIIQEVKAEEQKQEVSAKEKKPLSEKQRARYETMKGKQLMGWPQGVPKLRHSDGRQMKLVEVRAYLEAQKQKEEGNVTSQPNSTGTSQEGQSVQNEGGQIQENIPAPPEISQEGKLFQ